ncbi:hypothetical protein, partial [Clostridium sp. FS41]
MATVDEILTKQAYAAGDETWTKDNNYPSYTMYAEPEYVPVTNKRIADFNDQVSVRGEQNAQFVGFQLPRYDDAMDLTKQNLYIHYQTAYGGSDGVPCNVSWSDNYVRMCWMIPGQATQQPEAIQMMIYATGTNSVGDRTVWKTLPATYTIHDGLEIGGGIPEPDQSWYEQFVQQMEGKVSTAQGYANDAQASKVAAAGSATAAAQSADASAQALQENKDYVESQKETFVGYNKRETDLKYANALIGSASGTGRVTVGDAWEAPIPGVEVAGKSEQFTTTGAQMLDASKLVRTHNDVVFSVREDGSILVTGNTLQNAANSAVTSTNLSPGTYYVSGSVPIDNSKIFVKAKKWYSDSSSVVVNDTSFVVDGTETKIDYFIQIYQGLSDFKVVVYPMLNAGPIPLPWEPYTGGKSSPSPEYPQEVIGTGTVTTGAQLLDTEAYELGTFGNATGNPNDSEITYRWLQYIPVTEGSTIYFKKPLCICYYDSDKRFVSCDESPGIYQRLVPQTAAFIRCRTFAGDFADFNHRDYMISNNPISAWEPYTGGKPSPSEEYPQPLDVTVTGENLFDASLLKSMAGGAWSSSDGGRRISVTGIKPYAACTAVVPIECVRGKTVTLSGNIESRTNVDCPVAIQGRLTLSDGRLEYYAATYKKMAITIPEDAQSFKIELITNNRDTALDIANTTVFTDVLLSFDAEATWEPFAGYQTATIQLTAPLHGIGEYRDRITMTKRIDRCVELIFDGSEDWRVRSWSRPTTSGFYALGGLPEKMRARPGLCNQGTVTPGETEGVINQIWLGSSPTYGSVDLYVMNNSFYNPDIEDKGLAAWKAHLASHPLKIVTYLDTPVETDLPAATQTALNALTTFTGTTHITITA